VIALEDTSSFELAVGEDGTIEITGRTESARLTVDVAPVSARTSMVVQNTDGTIAWSSRDTSDNEVVRQVERAA
jgi:hypothetical protein